LEANSVPQAVLKLENVIPDVLLVDVMMPQIDGLQLVEQLASDPKWLNTKIIVTSTKVEASNRMTSWERGADAFLPKPFLSKDLLDVIEYVLS
jgi:CheY-like chemotaxis protein